MPLGKHGSHSVMPVLEAVEPVSSSVDPEEEEEKNRKVTFQILFRL